jgi:hypothetical protein
MSAQGLSATSTDVRYTGRVLGHSGHQPSELSARPPSLAISLAVTLLGGLDLGGLTLLALARRTGGDDKGLPGALQPPDLLITAGFGDTADISPVSYPLGGLTLLALARRTGGDDKGLLDALQRSIFLHHVGQPSLA